MKPEPKYDTFWGRFWAIFFDLALLGLIYIIIDQLFIGEEYSNVRLIITVIETFAIYIYKIVMHAAFGKTLGKMLFGVIVVNKDESQLTLGRSTLREIIPLGIFATFGIIAGPVLSIRPEYGMAIDDFINKSSIIEIVFVIFMSLICFGWELAIFVSLQISSKRSSIQDKLSRTIILRQGNISRKGLVLIILILAIRLILHHDIGIG